MISQRFKKLLINLLIIVLIFLIDRFSKIYILNILETRGVVDIYINFFLNFKLIWNYGIGFGLLSFDHSTIYNFITFLIILINIIIFYLILRSGESVVFFSIILGGSLGNLFDRLYYSAVPDFIDLNYNGYHWFIFNIADIFISFGIICLIFVELINYKKH